MGQVDAVRLAARAYLLAQPPPAALLRRRRLRLAKEILAAQQRVHSLCSQLDAERRELAALQAQAAHIAGLPRGSHTPRAVDSLCAALRRAFSRPAKRGAAPRG